jgi:hypothetical protein
MSQRWSGEKTVMPGILDVMAPHHLPGKVD